MIQKTETEVMRNWQGDPSRPLVSIRCTAYNHEKYIAQCLDGFLMQETTFPFEIVIHDDASTDKTADIIQVYEKRYPTIIHAIYEVENQYSKHDGSLKKIIDQNCSGKYIAICEGDDYWIHPQKLQMQYEYMEKNPNCSLCTHNTVRHDVQGIENDSFFSDWEEIHVLDAEEIILNWNIHTSSYFFHREMWNQNNLPRAWCGDFRQALFFFSVGDVVCLPQVMSVYNYGITTGATMKIKYGDSKKIIEAHRQRRKLLLAFNLYTDYRYSNIVEKRVELINKLMLNEIIKSNSALKGQNKRDAYRKLKEMKKEPEYRISMCLLPRLSRIKQSAILFSYTVYKLKEIRVLKGLK